MNLDQLCKKMEKDLVLFAKKVCKNIITSIPIPDFHKEIYQLIKSENRLVLAAPRGFSKSTLVSKVYPLWLALYKIRKDICIISASESLATEHLRYIKQEIESNPLISTLFGDLKSEKWTESHIIVKHSDGTVVNLRAKGAGGQLRGFRPDCIILDDIETDESVESEEQRRKLKNWLFKACINTLLPEGQLLIIGTIIHPLAVLNELLNDDRAWVRKKYTAYIDSIQEEGHELWAKARPHKWLQERKAEIGSAAFASEYLNNPMLDESAPIKPDQIRYWKTLPEQISYSIAVDPAYSDDEKADYKVAVVVGIDEKNNRYLVDYIRTHNPSGEFIDGIINLYMRYKHKLMAVGVPNSGTEKEFFRSVQEKAMQRAIGMPIVSLTNTFTDATGKSIRRKSKRITAALQPLFEQGKYYIAKCHTEAREELLSIGYSRWDDLTDAMCYCEQILVPQFNDTYKEDDYGRYGEPLESEKQKMIQNYGF